MPQAVDTYIQKNNLQLVDETKRRIIELYEDDFFKIDESGLASEVYDSIPASLTSMHRGILFQMQRMESEELRLKKYCQICSAHTL